jgi:hypothetical protein
MDAEPSFTGWRSWLLVRDQGGPPALDKRNALAALSAAAELPSVRLREKLGRREVIVSMGYLRSGEQGGG